MSALYPDGFQGRSIMDCACNCGGYLFWAKEIGADGRIDCLHNDVFNLAGAHSAQVDFARCVDFGHVAANRDSNFRRG